ncbi:calpain-10 isoform X2 [Bombina bombina]|uniref:calpain-10 isoform X2 n=1 Tax=Bombina bombina TaxID=8345 RepID=UPI00235B1408|nr:calpain-10 isoform X2 [Bombina bombina]
MCCDGAGDMQASSSQLFVDSEFPANLSSLVCGGRTPLSSLSDRITWKRPQEICTSPRLFPENGRDGLGKQGILGDCWFVCACSALQRHDPLLSKVFPPGQCTWTDCGYQGRFTCRFWHFGRWVDVTIDDCLPCLGNKLCFSTCQDKNAFWLPLLEKAYAKLHGCYEALWAGQVSDALVDLTGGLVQRWPLGEEQDKEEIFNKMLELKDLSAMSCSVLHCREGARDLGEFHAFTITEIKRVSSKDNLELVLLRVHNPWGRTCWEGSWGKGGNGWTRLNPADSSQLQNIIQEGEFWVEKTEFLREFDEVTAAFPIGENGHIQSIWTGQSLLHTQQIHGSWIKGWNAGGSRNNESFPNNPKFWLRVRTQCEVCLLLMQRPRNGERTTNHLHGIQMKDGTQTRSVSCAVGLHVWKVEKRRFNLQKTLLSAPVVGTSSHSYDRQLYLHCELSPGYHLVVSSTFIRDTEGDFLLRILSTGNITLNEVATPRPLVTDHVDVSMGTWDTQVLQGSWEKSHSAGGSRNFPSFHINPSFPFCVPPGASIVRVTLRQQCERDQCHAIGFHIYTVPHNSSQSVFCLEPTMSCIPHTHSQEVSQLCALTPGQYVLVPSTYLPDQESEFTVTISVKTERKQIQSRETLGRILQEVSVKTVMK